MVREVESRKRTAEMTTPKHKSAFESWWLKTQDDKMLHSKYLARKAWNAAVCKIQSEVMRRKVVTVKGMDVYLDEGVRQK